MGSGRCLEARKAEMQEDALWDYDLSHYSTDRGSRLQKIPALHNSYGHQDIDNIEPVPVQPMKVKAYRPIVTLRPKQTETPGKDRN